MARILSSLILGICIVVASTNVDLDVIVKVQEVGGQPHATLILDGDD